MLSEIDQADILKLLFSPNGGMGYSILRNEIGNGPEDAGKKDGTVASIEPQPDQFNWTGDEDQIWLMNEAKKRGCMRFFHVRRLKQKMGAENYEAFTKLVSRI